MSPIKLKKNLENFLTNGLCSGPPGKFKKLARLALDGYDDTFCMYFRAYI